VVSDQLAVNRKSKRATGKVVIARRLADAAISVLTSKEGG
jgi:hypothetical protein